jgi:hypothetical protein
LGKKQCGLALLGKITIHREVFMITGVPISGLSNLYRQQTNDYTKVLGQIASGRTFAKPSDDFTSFMRMRGAEQSAARFQGVNDRLVEAKEKSTAASSLGNAVYEGLMELKGMADAYATADSDGKERLAKEFTAKQNALNGIVSANSGIVGSSATTVNINPDGTTASNLTFNPGNISKLQLDMTSSFDTDFKAAVEEVITYSANADAFNSSVDRQLTINQNIVSAKESTAAAIGAIDEVSAIGKATALAVRQQATIAMAAQANISQSNIARLFS